MCFYYVFSVASSFGLSIARICAGTDAHALSEFLNYRHFDVSTKNLWVLFSRNQFSFHLTLKFVAAVLRPMRACTCNMLRRSNAAAIIQTKVAHANTCSGGEHLCVYRFSCYSFICYFSLYKVYMYTCMFCIYSFLFVLF